MSLSEPLDDPWADRGPSDRLATTRRRPDADRPRDISRGREDQQERAREGDAWEPGAASFERVPPQDPEAEQSVLGGMLLSKDAIADVVEVLKGRDFYRPAHETVYQAILDLYAKGEPADPITVAAELTRRGEITRVGGVAYLHSLVQMVPTAANAQYYAEIVHERAVLRRLVEAGTRITQMGYAADGDVDEIVNSAQAEIYAVTEQRTSEDYLALSDIMEGALDEIEAIGSRSGEMTGVPTGFTDFDSLTNGLHPGQMIVIAARPAMGKALALDTLLPTPTGWTTMGEVTVGDRLLGADGRPTRVVAVTEVMVGRPCHAVVFDDGTTVIADADHQWLTDARAPGRRAEQATGVRTTKEIASTLYSPTSPTRLAQPHHSVRNTVPLELPERELPLPPYALGAQLGTARGARVGALAQVGTAGLRVTAGGDLPGALDPLHAPERPRIPRPYLRASLRQRRALLAGLLDTAGTIAPDGAVRLTLRHLRLAEDVRELVVSLGQRCTICSETSYGAASVTTGRDTVHQDTAQRGSACQGTIHRETTHQSTTHQSTTHQSTTHQGTVHRGSAHQVAIHHPTAYHVTFTATDDAFGPRRAAHVRGVRRPADSPPSRARRFITDVREVPSVPVRCVQVDAPDHLYLTTRSMVPTHNSTLALDFARAASIRNELPSVIFSLEMGRNEIAMRLLAAEARVALHHMRSGTMTDEDWTRLARRMPEVTAAPLYIDDSPNLSMMEIRAKCRRLKQRHDLKLVVIDYLQLMQSGGSRRPESRQQEVSDMSRNLKLLAKELELPVVALSQLNRGPEQRTDKKPMVSDLRESGCVTAGTRVLRADTGAEVSMGELLESGARDIPVWSLDDQLRLVPRTMTHVFPSGVKEVFRLRLASGREIEATANHPFLTYDGWTPLGDLSVGSRVAVPRRTDAPECVKAWPEPELVMLAHMLGNGCAAPHQPIRYTSNDEANLRAVEEAANHFGITPRREQQQALRHVYLPAPFRLTHGRRNPIAEWLDGFGLYGRRSYEKFLPPEVFALPEEQVRIFLRHLWATAGAVTVTTSGAVRVYFATTSERLARDLHLLLLRLEIRARLRAVGNTKGRPGWTVDVCGVEDQRRFLTGVGVHGNRAFPLSAALERLSQRQDAGRFDTIPAAVRGRVREVMIGRQLTLASPRASLGSGSSGNVRSDSPPIRSRLCKIAETLDDMELKLLCANDVFWDEVVSIQSIGNQEVYDATVPGTHNFIANGINLHNSIEQDADMVILLHREDAYEKESPRAGEADLIVAKHRNGPTATITVAFQGHYSRFVDMAGT